MRLFVPLTWQEFEVLERLAFAERRRPRDQAAVILARALTSAPPADRGGNTTPTEAATIRKSRAVERVPA
jgi:hypothetical protein